MTEFKYSNGEDLIGILAVLLPLKKDEKFASLLIKAEPYKNEKEESYFNKYVDFVGRINVLANTIDLLLTERLKLGMKEQGKTLGWKINQIKNLPQSEVDKLNDFNEKWNIFKHGVLAFDENFTFPIKLFKNNRESGFKVHVIDEEWYLNFRKGFSDCAKIVGTVSK